MRGKDKGAEEKAVLLKYDQVRDWRLLFAQLTFRFGKRSYINVDLAHHQLRSKDQPCSPQVSSPLPH
jgi:hypothetical protein